MTWDDARIDDEVARITGKTIERVEPDSEYERTQAVRLYFTDGTAAEIGHWAEHASDSGLDFEWLESTK